MQAITVALFDKQSTIAASAECSHRVLSYQKRSRITKATYTIDKRPFAKIGALLRFVVRAGNNQSHSRATPGQLAAGRWTPAKAMRSHRHCGKCRMCVSCVTVSNSAVVRS